MFQHGSGTEEVDNFKNLVRYQPISVKADC